MLRYYYDSAESQCKKFLYGGCEGNRNRFISEEACLIECHDDDGDRATAPVPTPRPSESPAGPIGKGIFYLYNYDVFNFAASINELNNG